MYKIEWQILGQAVYSNRRFKCGKNADWFKADDIAQLYKDILKNTGVKLCKSEKFFRIGEHAAITILTTVMALEQCPPDANIDFGTAAVLGYGDDGSHYGNLKYWHDFEDNGKVAAQGHLFVGTLASTPLCQLALTLGCHAPVYYVSPVGESSILTNELDFVHGQCRNLFFIEVKNDYCSCMVLSAANSGFASEEIVKLSEEMR